VRQLCASEVEADAGYTHIHVLVFEPHGHAGALRRTRERERGKGKRTHDLVCVRFVVALGQLHFGRALIEVDDRSWRKAEQTMFKTVKDVRKQSSTRGAHVEAEGAEKR
jgi:hypothetical protein